MFLTPWLLYSWDGNIISSPKFENWRFLLEFPNATWLACVCCGVVSVVFEKDCFVVHSCPDKLLLLIEISNPLKPEDAGERRASLGQGFVCPLMKEFRVEQASSRVYKFLTSKNFRLSCGGKSFYADE